MNKCRKITLNLNGIDIEICRKPVKRLSLSIYPPDGHLKISAPLSMPLKDIQNFIVSKMDWIARQRARIHAQPGDAAEKIGNGTSRPLWGKSLSILLKENQGRNTISLENKNIIMCFEGKLHQQTGHMLLELLYKRETWLKAQELLPKWLIKLDLPPLDLKIRSMKSRWGSCRPEIHSITLNSALAKRNLACLEYVIVHELGHFFVRNHGPQFKAFLTKYFQDWNAIENILNPRQNSG